MAISKIGQNLYTKILKNNVVLKGLENISEHSTSFSAGTSLVLSTFVRPFAIHKTPDVEKENKQYAIANSISSGLIKFGIVEAVALPIEYAVKNIDKNPEKYLKASTITKLINKNDSRSYKLLTQVMKLGAGFLTAIPKSMLTIALIPVLMDAMFFKSKRVKAEPDKNNSTFGSKVNFTGGLTDKLSKGMAKIINSERIQNLAVKYQNKDKDIAKHMTAMTDILLTGSFAYQTNKSNKIKENRKKVLIYNNVISTGITLGLGYAIDKLVKNKSQNFIKTFTEQNKDNPKLMKYIEGINILRPALIFAGVYYCLLPMVSTYIAEKVDKYVSRH
jgi:hypothetical protein